MGNPSPEMLEKGRFLLSSMGIGEGNTSAGDLREAFSRAVSTLWPSLPSIWLMRSASSLMYLPPISNVDRVPFLKYLCPYPLLGPRFCGTRLKRHCAFDLLQLEHGCSTSSD